MGGALRHIPSSLSLVSSPSPTLIAHHSPTHLPLTTHIAYIHPSHACPSLRSKIHYHARQRSTRPGSIEQEVRSESGSAGPSLMLKQPPGELVVRAPLSLFSPPYIPTPYVRDEKGCRAVPTGAIERSHSRSPSPSHAPRLHLSVCRPPFSSFFPPTWEGVLGSSRSEKRDSAQIP